MKNAFFGALLYVIGCAAHAENYTYTNVVIRIGDKFGDGWNGAAFAIYSETTYNASRTITEDYFRDESTYSPAVGSEEVQWPFACGGEGSGSLYMTIVDPVNNTFLADQEPPAQYWEIYWQITINTTVVVVNSSSTSTITNYYAGWNSKVAFHCHENGVTMLDWSENLLESIGSCPECQHPKPKPKPKPKGKKGDDAHRYLKGDDDKMKAKPPPPVKYWPVPVKLMDPTDQDGWFDADNMAYSEFTISDSTRMNLVAQGTLCAAKGTDGYSTVCETMLPDGHYIFRAAGQNDANSANYTWQLCGKEAVKYELGMSDAVLDAMNVTTKNASMMYDFRTATGGMGNEVAFQIKKGKCIVDETIINLMDYANGTSSLNTVLELDGHVLLDSVYFAELSSIESAFLEKTINEFVSLEAEKIVTVTSVENVEGGTLVGYRVTASHVESQLMDGTMESVIQAASDSFQAQISGGVFLSFMKNSIQTAGLGNDQLVTVNSVQFVDLDFDFTTLRDGKTMSGDVITGGDHEFVFNPIFSTDKIETKDASSSSLVLDVVAASGVFAVVAVIVVLVVMALKPPAETASGVSDIDNSSANLVVDEEATAVSEDPISDATKEFSYQDTLSAALTQRWEMNTEDDSVRL